MELERRGREGGRGVSGDFGGERWGRLFGTLASYWSEYLYMGDWSVADEGVESCDDGWV
jgi:hypothetical protein